MNGAKTKEEKRRNCISGLYQIGRDHITKFSRAIHNGLSSLRDYQHDKKQYLPSTGNFTEIFEIRNGFSFSTVV